MGKCSRTPDVIDCIIPLYVIAYAIWTVYVNVLTVVGANFETLLRGLPAIAVIGLGLWYAWFRFNPMQPENLSFYPTVSGDGSPAKPSFVIALAAIAWVAILVLFHQYVIFWTGAVAALGTGWFLLLRKPWPELAPSRPKQKEWLIVAAICVAAVAVTLIANRPDADDSFYLSIPATLLRFRDQPILLHDTIYHDLSQPIQLLVYRVHSYEVLIGTLAKLLNLPPIVVAHTLLPPCFAGLTIIGWTQLLKVISPRHWASALVALFLCVLMLGEAHHSYGNFAFVRLFQGKAVLATTIVPIVIYLIIVFSRSGSLRHWLLLFAAQIGAVGMSSTAIFIIPIVAIIAFASAWRPRAGATTRLAIGLAASSYVAMAGFWLIAITHGGEGFANSHDLPSMFDMLMDTFGSWSMAIVLTTLLCAWAFTETASTRAFFIGFALGFFLLVLNPFTMNFVAHHLSGYSTYWRLTWVAPIPCMFAVIAIGVYGRWKTIQPNRFVGNTIVVCACVAIAMLFSHINSLRPANGVALGEPGLKVVKSDFAVAQQIVMTEPENSVVLAPEVVAMWIPTFVVHPIPLAVRALYLKASFGVAEGDRRLELMQYVSGANRTPGSLEGFTTALTHYSITGVVVARSAPWHLEIDTALAQAHFTKALNGGYEIWSRKVPI